MKTKIEYALYKGDEFLDLGTKEYLAKKYNVKPHTIVFYASPSYKERCKNNKDKLICEKLIIKEGEEDEQD